MKGGGGVWEQITYSTALLWTQTQEHWISAWESESGTTHSERFAYLFSFRQTSCSGAGQQW